MRILVSGWCEFFGSALALGLRTAGHEVGRFDNFCGARLEHNFCSTLNMPDSSKCEDVWGWRPRRSAHEICAEISGHAREHPERLKSSAV